MWKFRSAKSLSHPVDIGLSSEAAILSGLVKRGLRVLVPFGENQRYDLVVDDDGDFYRAQCKTGRLRDGVVRFSTQSVRSNMSGSVARRYDGDADIFIVFCPENDRIYVVPVSGCSRREMCLRVEPSRNNQVVGVNMAADYELPA